MMKILFLSLFFSLFSFGQEIQKESFSLPYDLAGVKLNSSDDKSVSLDVSYIMVNNFVVVKKKAPSTLTSFFENLMWIYKNKQKEDLLDQFDSESRKVVMNLKNFDSQFEVMSLIRKPFLKSIQVLEKGYLFRWTDESFLDERKIFVIKEKNKFKIAKMNVSKEDSFFWNTNLYFKYQRFEKKKPKITEKFSSIKDSQVKELTVAMDQGFTHLNIFKSTDEFVNLIALDNYESSSYPFKDYNDKERVITLRFSGKNFKSKGVHKIHLLQSTYPIGNLSLEHFKNSASFKVIKD